MLWSLFWNRSQLIAQLSLGEPCFLALCLPLAPYAVFAGRNVSVFMGRASEVTLSNPVVYEHLWAKYGVSTLPALLVQQIERTLFTFHLFSDTSPQFAFPGPMLDGSTAALLTLGLGLAWACRVKRFSRS